MVSYYSNLTARSAVPLKHLSVIGRIISHACIYYTAASLALYTGGMIVSGIEREWIPTLKMMYIVFLFSLLFSSVNQLVLPARWPAVLKLLLHYDVSVLIFYVLFILWGGYSQSGSSVLIILVFFTLLYAAGALIYFLCRYASAAARSKSAKYDRQFPESSARK